MSEGYDGVIYLLGLILFILVPDVFELVRWWRGKKEAK